MREKIEVTKEHYIELSLDHSKVYFLGDFNYFIENTQKCVNSVFE